MLHGGFLASVALICVALTAVALGTLLGTHDGWPVDGSAAATASPTNISSTTHVTLSLWSVCAKVTVANAVTMETSTTSECLSNNAGDLHANCRAYTDHYKTIQAAYIIALILGTACFVVGVVSYVRPEFLLNLPVSPKVPLLLLTILFWLMTALSAALAFAIPTDKYCEFPPFNAGTNFAYGPSPFLMMASLAIATGSIVLACTWPIPDPKADEAGQVALTELSANEPVREEGAHAPAS
jgi:hypothetical protein